MHAMEISKRILRRALRAAHVRLTVIRDFQAVCCELWTVLWAEKVRQTDF